MKKLRGGRLAQHNQEKLQEAANELYNLKLFIDESGALSSFDLRAKARRLKQKQPDLSLLVIDYLQLMHQSGRVESRQLEVSEISRALKQLSQRARAAHRRALAAQPKSRRARARAASRCWSDLRESGAIEQDADVVMFIHRDEAATIRMARRRPGAPVACSVFMPVELIIAKQRNGPVS